MKKTILSSFLVGVLTLTLISCKQNGNTSGSNSAAIDTVTTGEVVAELTDAPLMPAPLTYTSPKKVKVSIDVIEKVMKIADSTGLYFLDFWWQSSW